MATESMVRASAASGFVDALALAGVDAPALLAEVGLDVAALADPFGEIPLRCFVAMFEAAAAHTEDPHFGLHLGLAFAMTDLGVLGYVLANSPTIEDAFRNLGRYFCVHQEGTSMGVERDGATATLSYRVEDPTISPRRQDAEFSIGMCVAALRTVTTEGWAPREVRFEHAAPADASEHRRLLGTTVSFGHDTNSVVLEAALLDQPTRGADASLLPILERHIAGLLAERPAASDLAGQVRHIVARALGDGCPTIDMIADELGTTARTLRRRLDELGTTFQELVDAARLALAGEYLGDAAVSLTEVAFLLGYSDASAFTRAYKRWTGETPRAARKRALG